MVPHVVAEITAVDTCSVADEIRDGCDSCCRSRGGRGGGQQDAQILSVRGDGEYCIEHGVKRRP